MLNRQTRRLYYEDPYHDSSGATVVRVGPDYLELDQTLAFPEGGGQEADHGIIGFEGGLTLRYVDVKTMFAMPARLADFPDVHVGGVIWHMIAPEDQHLLACVCEGMRARVDIDPTRRAWLSLSHTASHLLYLSVGAHRLDAIGSTLGCHIKTDGARFDFSVGNRFLPEEIAAITDFANDRVGRNLDIEVFAHEGQSDARYWRCDGQTVPCGGAHLSNTASIGELRLKRKCLGKGKERLSCEFPFATIDLSPYHQVATDRYLP